MGGMGGTIWELWEVWEEWGKGGARSIMCSVKRGVEGCIRCPSTVPSMMLYTLYSFSLLSVLFFTTRYS